MQGVGNVGSHLCEYLADAGAVLVVADIDDTKTALMAERYGAGVVSLDEIMEVDADVLAPCALGAILNKTSIPNLRVAIVAGGANNQLDTAEDGKRVRDAGILYAPDYVINAGGIINVACEYYGGCNEEEVMKQVAAIGPRLTGIFRQSEESGIPTNEVADALARRIVSGGAD